MKRNLRNLIFTGLLVSIGIILSQYLSISYPPTNTVVKFGIGYVPLIIISILFGPQVGLFAGLSQDLLGYLLKGPSQGLFYLGFTLNAVLYGVLPGLIYRIKAKFSSKTIFAINTVFLSGISLLGIWFLLHPESISQNDDFSYTYRMIFIGFGLFSSLFLQGISVYHVVKHPQNESFHILFLVIMVMYIIVSVVLTPLWLLDLYQIPMWAQIPLRVIKMPLEVLIYVLILSKLLSVLDHQLNKVE